MVQRQVRRDPEGHKLLWHGVARGNNRVHSQGHPDIPASPAGSRAGSERLKPRARLTRGLKTEAGTRHFVDLMAHGMA